RRLVASVHFFHCTNGYPSEVGVRNALASSPLEGDLFSCLEELSESTRHIPRITSSVFTSEAHLLPASQTKRWLEHTRTASSPASPSSVRRGTELCAW